MALGWSSHQRQPAVTDSQMLPINQCRDHMAVLAILGVASGAHGGFPLIQKLSDSRLLVVMGSCLWLKAVHPDPHPWL